MGAIQDLFKAIKAGDAARLQQMLRADPALIDSRGPAGETPLLTAVYYGAREIIRLLMEHGARPDPFEAAALGDVRRLGQLLQDQPDMPHLFSHDGWTPLHLAAHFGQVLTIDWLLRHGASLEARSVNRLSNTALHAAAAGRRRRALELLLVAGADPNAADADGHTPLHIAAQNGDVELARLLLGFGARPDSPAQDEQTPLALASREGHQPIVDLFRERGAAGPG